MPLAADQHHGEYLLHVVQTWGPFGENVGGNFDEEFDGQARDIDGEERDAGSLAASDMPLQPNLEDVECVFEMSDVLVKRVNTDSINGRSAPVNTKIFADAHPLIISSPAVPSALALLIRISIAWSSGLLDWALIGGGCSD